MQQKDTPESPLPNPKSSNSTQHMFEPSVPVQTNHLIIGENEKVYAFHHDQRHLSLKQRFGLMSRTRQVLTVVGSVSVVFIISMIVLTFVMYEPPRKSSTNISTQSKRTTTNTDLNGDGVIDSKDTEIAAADVNNDGVVDEKDAAFTAADVNGDGVVDENDTLDSGTELSWWQALIAKVKRDKTTTTTTSSTASDTTLDTTSDETSYDDGLNTDEPDYVDSEEAVDGTVATDVEISDAAPIDVALIPSSSDGATYTIGTWNVYGANKQNVGSRAADILKSAQVLGLQEVHSSTKMNQVKTAACATCAYDVYMPSAGDSYPLLWEKALFKKVDQGSAYMSSPPGLAKRYAVWVKLQNKKTSKLSYVINTHLPPSVESGGNSTNGKYTASYKTHMDNLVALIKSKKADGIPLFVTGDFNVNFRRDCKVSFFPCQALAQGQSVVSGWASTSPKYNGVSGNQGTHASKDRLIDYVMAWKRSDVTANTSTVLGGNSYGWGGSDHKPSLLNVTVR